MDDRRFYNGSCRTCVRLHLIRIPGTSAGLTVEKINYGIGVSYMVFDHTGGAAFISRNVRDIMILICFNNNSTIYAYVLRAENGIQIGKQPSGTAGEQR